MHSFLWPARFSLLWSILAQILTEQWGFNRLNGLSVKRSKHRWSVEAISTFNNSCFPGPGGLQVVTHLSLKLRPWRSSSKAPSMTISSAHSDLLEQGWKRKERKVPPALNRLWSMQSMQNPFQLTSFKFLGCGHFSFAQLYEIDPGKPSELSLILGNLQHYLCRDSVTVWQRRTQGAEDWKRVLKQKLNYIKCRIYSMKTCSHNIRACRQERVQTYNSFQAFGAVQLVVFVLVSSLKDKTNRMECFPEWFCKWTRTKDWGVEHIKTSS